MVLGFESITQCSLATRKLSSDYFYFLDGSIHKQESDFETRRHWEVREVLAL